MNPAVKNGLTYGAGACLAICLPLAALYEGMRPKPYHDTTGTLTICYGETMNVRATDVKTPAECEVMLKSRMQEFAIQVRQLVKVDMTNEQWAAFTDFSYNAGITNFANSTILRKFNAGDKKGACNELPRWVYSKGVKLPGLVRRREAERQICLKGLQ